MTVQDWGVTYDELEPYYDKFEYLCGISGKAGNLRGQIQAGGNPFEGPRQRDYPNPPLDMVYGPTLFGKAAEETGHHPFPCPAANMSRPYTNPLGVQLGPCTYCGFCEKFGCGNYSKSSAQTTILPVLMRKKNFELRTECEVMRVEHDAAAKRATGVVYVDTQGEEYEQPAELVIMCAYALHNPRLLLLSGIGQPYDPRTGQGRDRQELRLPDRLRRRCLLRGQDPQSVRRRGRARRRCRRIQRRQFRPQRARLHRRRLSRLLEHQRPADRASSDAQGHAELGRQVEAGDRQALPDHGDHLDARRGDEPPHQLSRPRSDLSRRLRPAADAHDLRFHRQRASDVGLSHRPRCRHRQGDAREARSTPRSAPAITPSCLTRPRTIPAA